MGDKILIGDDRMKICRVEECNNKHFAKGYCRKHYKQMYRHGQISKTIYDCNEFVKHETYAEMIIFDKNGNEKNRTLIDLEDIERIKEYKWCESHNYIICRELNVRLHRFIMNCPEELVVDHINHNPLDNRKENLRICTSQQNNMNRSIQSNNTSDTVGVSWRKDRNKWRAYITLNGKQKTLGLFVLKEDAIKARKEAEEKYFGEFRNKE